MMLRKRMVKYKDLFNNIFKSRLNDGGLRFTELDN